MSRAQKRSLRKQKDFRESLASVRKKVKRLGIPRRDVLREIQAVRAEHSKRHELSISVSDELFYAIEAIMISRRMERFRAIETLLLEHPLVKKEIDLILSEPEDGGLVASPRIVKSAREGLRDFKIGRVRSYREFTGLLVHRGEVVETSVSNPKLRKLLRDSVRLR